MHHIGFKPIIAGKPKILILGSMPSATSLQQQQYYAHPRNLFWQLMSSILQFPNDLPYKDKTRQLIEHRIALWDVIERCERQGSLDTAIVNDSIIINDFNALFATYPSITHIFFNGRKAESEFRKRVIPVLHGVTGKINYHTLPSTSPANAGTSKQDKLRQWSLIKILLNKNQSDVC